MKRLHGWMVTMGILSVLGCGGSSAGSQPSSPRGTLRALPRSDALVFFGEEGWLVYDLSDGSLKTWETTTAKTPQDGSAFTLGSRRFSHDGRLYKPALPGGATHPTLAPAGNRFAYVSRGTVTISNVPVGEVIPVGPGTNPTWSSDGTLAFSTRDLLTLWTLEKSFAASAPAPIGSIGWTADDETVVFGTQSLADGARTGAIFRVGRTGGAPVQVTQLAAGEWAGHPVVSPDGERVAFLHQTRPTDPRQHVASALAVTPLQGGPAQTLVPVSNQVPSASSNKAHSGVLDGFAWSPDGKKLAFIAAFEGDCSAGAGGLTCHYDLYTVNADGTDLTRLTHLELSGRRDIAWVRPTSVP